MSLSAAGRPEPSMTIGDVLAALRPDFPDMTVSKIRFLDSAGLVAPQRSGSGYRRFSGADLDRLRQVLTLQRDHYLPLKVIRGHIEAGTLAATAAEPQVRSAAEPQVRSAAEPQVRSGAEPPAAAPMRSVESLPAPSPAGADRPEPRVRRPPAPRADGVPRPESASRPDGARAEAAARAGRLPGRPPSRRLRLDELIRVSGLSADGVAELEATGLIRSRGGGWYQPEDVVIASVAAQLAVHGVGTRHLRSLRSAADRELGLLEQSLQPVLRRGHPDARARAEDTARTLRELYAQLHAALVVSGLRELGIEPR